MWACFEDEKDVLRKVLRLKLESQRKRALQRKRGVTWGSKERGMAHLTRCWRRGQKDEEEKNKGEYQKG